MASKRDRERQERRLRRQIEALSRGAPGAEGAIRALLNGRYRYIRLPVGILFIGGGVLGFLPLVGFWMVPLGLMLIAVDIPPLRPAVSAGIVRLRRRVRVALRQKGRLARVGRRLRRK
jgi:hypothetical protein